MRTMWEKLSYWKVASFRALLYMLIIGVSDFLSNTEEWSQTTWTNTGPFMLSRLFLGSFVAMATVLIAFLDSTMNELRNRPSMTHVTTTTHTPTTVELTEVKPEDK